MTTKLNPRTCPALHDDWLAEMSAEGEPVSKPPHAATRRAPTPPPEDDWLGELDQSGDHPIPKGSRPPSPVETPRREPAESTRPPDPSKRPARRVISHALAWAGGVATGLALAIPCRQAPPPVVPDPVVASTDQASKPATIPPAQQTNSGDTRPQPPARPSPGPPDRPAGNTSAESAEGMVSPPMPTPSGASPAPPRTEEPKPAPPRIEEPKPAPPRIEEPKPAPAPRPQPTQTGPAMFNYTIADPVLPSMKYDGWCSP
jgi:hypothetical protein